MYRKKLEKTELKSIYIFSSFLSKTGKYFNFTEDHQNPMDKGLHEACLTHLLSWLTWAYSLGVGTTQSCLTPQGWAVFATHCAFPWGRASRMFSKRIKADASPPRGALPDRCSCPTPSFSALSWPLCSLLLLNNESHSCLVLIAWMTKFLMVWDEICHCNQRT